ncbi:MAG TPA: DMT family transporter [Bacteroidales bacterium]|nr:DMT family transporter [Bacteroidales bacterium]
MKESSRAYVFAGTAVLLWGTIATAFKIALAELQVVTMLGIATLVSTVVIFLIVLLTGKLHLMKEMTRKEILYSALLGFFNPLVYYIILLNAYSILPAQVAQPVNMIWPILIVFLSVPILKQKIPLRSYVALFISFCGVYVISSQGDPLHPGGPNPFGVFLALISSVLWALYFVLNVRDRRDQAVKLLTNFIFGSVYLIIAMLITGSFHQDISLKGFSAAVYCGFFEMGITFWLWLRALELSPTSDKVSNLVFFAPFISLILLHFIIHEPIYYTTPIGLVMIIVSVVIQNRRSGRKEKSAA